MRLSWNEVRARAAAFAEDWKDAAYEKGETQSFYNEFFEVFGKRRREVARYEQHVSKLDNRSGFIDLFWPGVLIVEQSGGWICAHGGVDQSNVAPEEEETIALLPADADASASEIRSRIQARSGAAVAVLISDSHGRPWRMGTVGVCIGCAGLPTLWDQRGLTDLYGYELRASEECIVDELCAAASLVMGQSSEGRPAAIIRGYSLAGAGSNAPARSIQRPAAQDLFR